MLRITVAAFLLCAFGQAAQEQQWSTSLDEARKKAKADGKPILCLVLEKGSKDCRKLEESFGLDAELKKLQGRFVCAKVDKDPKLAKDYGIKFYPATLFFTSEGLPLKCIVGALPRDKYVEQVKEVLAKIDRKEEKPAVAPADESLEKAIPAIPHDPGCPKECGPCSSAILWALDWLGKQENTDRALTALAGLAFLAHEGEAEAEARQRVEAAIQSLKTGDIDNPFEAMFLAEVYKKEGDKELGKRLAEIAQHLQEGWRDFTSTYRSLIALDALVEAGIPVDPEVLKKGEDYLLKGIGAPADLDALAGALSVLSLSRRQSVLASLEPSRARFRSLYRDFDPSGKREWSSLFFAARVMNWEGEGAWEDFEAHVRDFLLRHQEEDGHWIDRDGNGDVFATAIAVTLLQVPFRRLPVLFPRKPAATVKTVNKPAHLKPPIDTSRVKVFEREGGYFVDLIVSVDGPVEPAYLEELRKGLIGANRILYDATDGQMNFHRVEVLADREGWDKADLRIAKDFHDDKTLLPHPWAHGVTLVSQVVEIVDGKNREGKWIGEWVRLPYYHKGTKTPVQWGGAAESRLLAHELCHYIFGAKDEYEIATGKSYCPCMTGNLAATELCRDANHKDSRHARSCWALAKALYARLIVPREEDCGPWDPPEPVIELR